MAKTARHEYDSTKIVFLGFFPKEFRVIPMYYCFDLQNEYSVQ